MFMRIVVLESRRLLALHYWLLPIWSDPRGIGPYICNSMRKKLSFVLITALQNIPEQRCRTYMCFKAGSVATETYLIEKIKQISALP